MATLGLCESAGSRNELRRADAAAVARVKALSAGDW